MSRSLTRLALILAAAGLSASAARAQPTYTWVEPVTGVWSDPARWTPGVPVSDPTTVLVYNADGTTSYTSTNDLTTNPFVLNQIQFNNSGTGVITVAGNPLSFAGTTPTVTVSAGSAAITNVLTGASPLIKAGAGTLILSGASTYTGGTTVSAGRLVIAGPSVTSATTTNGGFPAGTITSGPVGTGTLTLGAGATLSADGVRAIRNVVTIGGTAANSSVIDIGAGNELTTTGALNGGATAVVTKTGAGLWRITSGSTAVASSVGTVIINGGNVLLTDPTNGGSGGGDLGARNIFVNNTGTFTFGNNPAFPGENPDLPENATDGTLITVNTGGTVVWNVGEQIGGFNLAGGALLLNAGPSPQQASTFQSGTITGPGGVGGPGTITKTTAGTVTVNGAPITNTGVLNIQDGVFSTNANFSSTGALGLGAASTAGTLQYTGASQTNVRPLTLTGQGGTVEVTTAATTLTMAAAVSGSGPLTKTGAGTLAFTGALNQTGTVTAAAGVVRVNPVTSAGGFAVSSGGTLAVNSGAASATFTLPTLAFAGSGSALRFDLNTAAAPTVPLVNVTSTDGLTLGSGGVTLAVTNTGAIPNGTFTLLDYAGAPITSGFNLALQGRTQGNLVYDTANTRVDVTITGSDSVRWTGAVNANWDVGTAPNVGGTQNWVLSTSGTPTNFVQGDITIFDDSSAVKTVNIVTAVQPTSVTVNTATSYTFQGAGSIVGTGPVTKDGTGTLVLATDNTYTGGTTVNAGTVQLGTAAGTTGSITGPVTVGAAGTLQVGAGGASGSITGPVANAGAVVFNRSDDTTFSGVFSGVGTLTKTGAGRLTIDGSSTGFTGTTTINGGTLRVADNGLGGDLNSASIVVNNGGRFEFFGPAGNSDLPGNTVITVNTGGVVEFTEVEDYGGIDLNGGIYNTGVNNNFGLTSTLRSGTIGNVAGVNGSFAGAGAFEKLSTGTVTITGVALNGTGAIVLDAGTLSTDSAIGTLGTAPISFGLSGGATLQYRGTAANVITRPVDLGEPGGTFDITQSAAVFSLNGPLTGGGSGVAVVTKTGAGTLVLGGLNSTAATFAVNGGALVVNGTPDTANNLGNGAASVASGGTLAGVGRVGGAVSVASGGTVQGGNPTTTAVGTLTASANVTVASGGAIRTRLAAPGNADALSLTAGGGTLALANSSRLDLRSLPGFGAAGAYTIATVANGGTNITVGGSTVADGAVLGQFTQGSGATGPVVIDVSNFGTTLAAGDMFTLNRAGNSLVLMFTPVPEPGTVLALAAAGLGVVGAVRRRVRK